MTSNWFLDTCSIVRDAVANDADVIAGVATVFAAFFIVVRMVRFHYQLSSDEGTGLGDVKAWDFLKPIVLLLLINYSPEIGKAINDVVNDAAKVICANNRTLAVKDLLMIKKQEELENAKKSLAQLQHQSFSNYDPLASWSESVFPQYARQCYLHYRDYKDGKVSNPYYMPGRQEVPDENGTLNKFNKEYVDIKTITAEDIGKDNPTEEDFLNYAYAHKLDYLRDAIICVYESADKTIDFVLELCTTKETFASSYFRDAERKVNNLEEDIKIISQAQSDEELKEKYNIDEGDLLIEYFPIEYPDFPDFFNCSETSWWNPIKKIAKAAWGAVTYVPRIIGYFFQCVGIAIEKLLFRALVWVFMNIVLIRGIMATMGMSVMLMFFPLVFLAMLFDRYKGAFGDWLVIFIELSLWYPLGTVVLNIALYSVAELFRIDMASREILLMIIVAGTLSVFSVAELAKTAMSAFGRHVEVSSSGGLMMTAAAGLIGAGKASGKMGFKAAYGKKLQQKKIDKASQKVQKKSDKADAKVDKYQQKRQQHQDNISKKRQDAAHLQKDYRSKVGEGFSAALPVGLKAMGAKLDARTSVKATKRLDKKIAKEKAKVKAAQKKVVALQKQSKNYVGKQLWNYTKEMSRLGRNQIHEQATNLSGSGDIVTSTNLFSFTKRNIKAAGKTAKGLYAAGAFLAKNYKFPVKAARGAVRAGKSAVGVAKDIGQMTAGSYQKVTDFVKKRWKKVGAGGATDAKAQRYAKVGGKQSTHHNVQKVKKSRNRQASHSRMYNK